MTATFEDDLQFIQSLSAEHKQQLLSTLKDRQPALVTHPGPQTMAAHTEADLTLYGGAAGGGKTFLAIILALTMHRRTLIIRKEAAQLYAMQDEIEGILGGRDGFNSQTGIWRLPNNEITDPQDIKVSRQIRFGGLNKPGDATKYQGAARDLLIIDEAANISYEEFVYLTVWERTAADGQRTRTLLCSNPPTDATGMWMVFVFRPWLDPDYPNPAESGEIRHFIVDEDDEHIEVPEAGDYVRDDDGELVVVDPALAEYFPTVYSSQSRTFISAKVDDNPHMIASGYKKKLQRLPRYLRERMLDGKFLASLQDDEFQCVPSEWIELSMGRWQEGGGKNRMTSMGVDPSRGGSDEMVIATRHGRHYEPLIKIPGVEVPTGPLAAARIVMARRDSCTVNLDSIGVGTSVYDKLYENAIDVEPMVGNEKTDETSKDGLFKFRNKRALWYWRMREALDPETGDDIALPPDAKLKQDLAAFTYKILDGAVIQVESKKEAKIRLGRSPDAGDAVIYANAWQPAVSDQRRGARLHKTKRCI